MNGQPPAGWYPDNHGDVRYWDGTGWTEHVQLSGPPKNDSATGPTPGRDGAFSKLGASIKKVNADRSVAKEDAARQQAEYTQAAGALVTSGTFGNSLIEIYAGGFVRVSTAREGTTQPSRMRRNTPYEKLTSINLARPDQKNADGPSALEGAVGPAVANLMKGGRALLKGSAPALAAAGVAHVASTGARTSFLTIVTDKAIHNLTNQMHNGLVNTVNKGHVEVGLALEAAGNSVLGVPDVPAHDPLSAIRPGESGPPVLSQAAVGPTLAERLRELADLHREGVLSDEEFAGAKAKLLSGL